MDEIERWEDRFRNAIQFAAIWMILASVLGQAWSIGCLIMSLLHGIAAYHSWRVKTLLEEQP